MNQFNKPLLGSMIDWGHPLSRGLVLCLLMNEGSGDRTYDISGNGDDGVLTSGPLWKPGMNGQAIDFDGIDDYIGMGDSGIDSMLTFGTTNFTISHWVKGDSGDASDQYSIGRGYIDVDASHRGYTCRTMALSRWYLTDSIGSTSINHGYLNNDAWVHLVLTVDRIITLAKSYVDGILFATKDISGLGNIASTTEFRIGKSSANRPLTGLIDDVRVWNRALSAQEVQDLYINPYGMIYQVPLWIRAMPDALHRFTAEHIETHFIAEHIDTHFIAET